jgi:transposase
MRGRKSAQPSMFCLINPDSLVPASHPIRKIKELADDALEQLSPIFDAMYADEGRPSIPPERLLKATILMALFSVRSERLFCEQLAYNLLYRWFLDMDMTEPVFERTAFSHNRERLLAHDVAGEFFRAVVGRAKKERLMSSEHFTVDGSLIEAWASMKSFKKKDDDDVPPPAGGGKNPSVDFHGERRTNDTHESSTDPEAKLARKGMGKEARLAYLANALMENRNGLLVDLRVAQATGTAEREGALEMLNEALPGMGSITVGADKGYDTRSFVENCREMCVVPHVAQNESGRRRSAIDHRTTRHAGYSVSQRVRKRVEEIFGWMKSIGGFRRTRFKGQARTQLAAQFVGAAYNLLRMAKLLLAAEVAA